MALNNTYNRDTETLELGQRKSQCVFVCVVCIRYGNLNLHCGSYPQGTAAEPVRRRDSDDHGHLPQCGTC